MNMARMVHTRNKYRIFVWKSLRGHLFGKLRGDRRTQLTDAS
jgi:hypothetical protein